MKRSRLQWIPIPSSAQGGMSPPQLLGLGPQPTWPGDPTLSWRDEFIFLLHTVAEVEHALMVQYLYASFSVPAQATWRRAILKVAKQEMGHFITVLNILRSLHAPLNLEREDYPYRSQFYPFTFHLEPLSRHSLAKYVLAEMPEDPGLDAALLQQLHTDARVPSAPALQVNRVGLLFERLRSLVTDHLTDAHFHADTEPLQAHADDWRADSSNGVIVHRIRSKADALEALRLIAEQGEGMQSPAAGEESHFGIFLSIYRELVAAPANPALPLPVDPNTSPVPNPQNPATPEEPDLQGGRITHSQARKWAILGNLRYRMLLVSIGHSLSIPRDADGPEFNLRERCFDEMFALARTANVLSNLPLAAGGNAATAAAGLPFELPYSLNLSDTEEGRWLAQQDLLDAAVSHAASIAAGTPEEQALLDDIRARDQTWQEIIRGRGLKPRSAQIVELRLLPPLVIGRFGSSKEPMENYDLGAPGANGYQTLIPAETLAINEATGEVSGTSMPASVRFRDNAGLIKPVCPFIEAWVRVDGEANLRPLTLADLLARGVDASALRWQVSAGNFKAYRRTGLTEDKITADSGIFNDHEVHPLTGHATNFKPGKTIPLGSVRYIRPNTAFPEIRLRFTPPQGKVFGPTAGDPNIVDDVYDAMRGRWDGYSDGDDETPPTTEPAFIYARDDQGRSLAYLDDACDAIVSLELRIPGAGNPLTATARFSSGPPHFAPDHVPIRTVADELEQMILGPQLEASTLPADILNTARQAADIIRRALDTVRLMNTTAMNTQGMSVHDRRLGRAREPIFPASRAQYARVMNIHQSVLSALEGLNSAPGTPERADAVNALQQMADILREFDQAGNLTDAGRRRMPAMMRGADGLHLALTRRQAAKVRESAANLASTPVPPPPPPMTPEEAMLELVRHFQSFASRHSAVDATGGETLRDLFADPPRVLEHLRTGVIQKGEPPGADGQPLIVPGDPDRSPFVQLIQLNGHPMQPRFAAMVPAVGKTGVQIVREWVASLTVA